jgi:hypothetical protein
VPWPAFPQKWPAAMAGGTLPDVAILHSENAVPMFLAGALHPNRRSSSRWRSGGLHNRIVVYRKDRLAEAGVNVPPSTGMMPCRPPPTDDGGYRRSLDRPSSSMIRAIARISSSAAFWRYSIVSGSGFTTAASRASTKGSMRPTTRSRRERSKATLSSLLRLPATRNSPSVIAAPVASNENVSVHENSMHTQSVFYGPIFQLRPDENQRPLSKRSRI